MNYIAKSPVNISLEEQVSDILHLLRPILRLSEQAVRESQSVTATPAMRRVLSQLLEQGSQTVPTLARELGTGRQYVQRLVNDLLAQGLVERHENAAHKTSLLVALTEQGQDQLEQTSQHEYRVLQQLADGLTGEEVQACRYVLDHLAGKFSDKAQTDQGRPVKNTRIERKTAEKPSEPVLKPQPHSVQGVDDIHEEIASAESHEHPAVLNWNGGGGLRIA